MISPSNSQPQDEEDSHTGNPDLAQDDENQNQQQEQPQSQSPLPQDETLENPDRQIEGNLELDHSRDQAQQLEEDGTDVVDQREELDDLPEQLGMSLSARNSDAHVNISDYNPLPLTSPTNVTRRNKRKKCNIKKLQAIEKKIQNLSEKLKPIPFISSKTLDFAKHEKLLKRLGLWDFVHIEFDRNIRVDLLAQLVATYDPKMRGSYVNEYKIMVNRADMGRAFKMPVKKDKSNVASSEAVDLDLEGFSEDSISFIEDFVSNWVLLHEDTWIMPTEVLNWTRVIKGGQPDKVDWAGLVWFMVEKELMKGQQLEDCYYASHLQYLIKSQREEVFMEEPKMEEEVYMKEEEDGVDAKIDAGDGFRGEDNLLMEEHKIELTLGQDMTEKEEVKDEDMMEVEECKEEEHGQWLLARKNSEGEHFLQRCNFEEVTGLNSHEDRVEEDEEEDKEEEEEEEEEAEDGFSLMPNGDNLAGDGLTGNLLHGLETAQLSFSLPGQLCDQSAVGPSTYGNGIKREMGLEHDMLHHSLNGSNKRLRTDSLWDHKSSDFGMCMEQMEHWMGKIRMMYEAKEHDVEESNMSQQLLLGELQKRDSVIEHLQKVKIEEIQKRDGEIFRLERELYVMGSLLEGYRKALKETQKSFTEYRQRCQLPEEPLYKDAGPGGVVLSTMELEKLRQKREEEYKWNVLMAERMAKELEEECTKKLETHLSKVVILDEKLMDLENKVKVFKELSVSRRASQVEDVLQKRDDLLVEPSSELEQGVTEEAVMEES